MALEWDLPKLVSGVILGVTFLGIFTEKFHGFDRTRFAMAGAGAMIIAGQIFGFYDPIRALEAVDWNVVFLLGCMMTIVAIMLPTGGFDALAYRIAGAIGNRPYLLMVVMGTVVTLLSLLLDNVTTVVIFGPLIILITRSLGITPIPFLLAAALLSDTGGVATLVGDPPNLMIGSAAGIDFTTFFTHMWDVVLLAWLSILIGLWFLFRSDFAHSPGGSDFGDAGVVQDPRTWHAALFSLTVVAILFFFHDRLEWEPWMVAGLGLTMLLFLSRSVEIDAAYERVEISLLTFFISLFMVIGGVESSHFLEYLGQFIEPFVTVDLLGSTLLLMWVAALFSALIDNIPFTAAMIPIIQGMESQGINVMPLWWALAVGVGLGGNGTHLGSTANVYIVTITERLARERGDPTLAITPGLWFRKGTPMMILSLLTASFIFWAFFEFYAEPI